MNDDELELRLRETQLRTELQRRVVPPDAPDSLYRHVAGLGLAEPVGRNERPASAAMSHGRSFRRGAGVLGGLATAASIAALLAVGLSWRSSHDVGEIGGGSSSPSTAATATATPYVSPTPRPTPSRFPEWSGAPAYVQFSGRLDAEFGYVVGIPEPYPGGNAMKLYLTYDGGATWVDRTPKDGGDFLDLHFADRMNAWFMQEVFVGSAPVTGDSLATHWIFRTSDGGVTWARYSLPAPTIYSMTSFYMPDGQHGLVTLVSADQSEPVYGYAAGSTSLTGRRAGMAMTGPARTVLNQLWRTDDGGATWVKLMDVRADANFPYGPTLATADEGWASGYTSSNAPLMLHSTDGGRSWKSSPLPLPKGYATSYWWQRVPSGSGSDLSLAGIVNNADRDVDVPTWAYVSWASTDGGVTWTLTSTTPLGLAGSVTVSSFSDRFLLVGSATSSASIQYVDMDSPGSPGVLDASSVCHGSIGWATMVSPQDAWALCTVRGATPRDWHEYLYGTTDGGKTWKKMMGAP